MGPGLANACLHLLPLRSRILLHIVSFPRPWFLCSRAWIIILCICSSPLRQWHPKASPRLYAHAQDAQYHSRRTYDALYLLYLFHLAIRLVWTEEIGRDEEGVFVSTSHSESIWAYTAGGRMWSATLWAWITAHSGVFKQVFNRKIIDFVGLFGAYIFAI